MFRNISKKWLEKSKTNPITFNCVNAFLLFGAGDVIQQKIDVNKVLENFTNKFEERKDLDTPRTFSANKSSKESPADVDSLFHHPNKTKKKFDYYQFLKITSYAVMSGPLYHLWYTKALPRLVPVRRSPSNGQVLSKVILDYFIASTT